MKSTRKNVRISVSVFGVLGIVAFTGHTAMFAADPVIHAAWQDGGAPELNVDYLVSTTYPASVEYPDVELITGSLTWQIWSTDTDNPDNIGDIGNITSPYPQNFGVEIERPGEIAGAREVKGINLDPQGEGSDANYSNLTGGGISGNLSGDLVLQWSDTQQGGVASLTIDGDAVGDIDVPVVSSVTISGDAMGTIKGTVLYPSLTIGGNRQGNVTICNVLSVTVGESNVG